MEYESLYRDDPHAFGVDPDPALLRCVTHLDRTRPVLDVGAGQGRNSFFLALQGQEVHALEPSAAGASSLRTHVENSRMPVTVFESTFESHNPDPGLYGAVLVFGLIPDIAWDSINALLTKIKLWTGPGSLVCLTGFTTQDPAYGEIAQTWRSLGQNSFRSPEGFIRTYLEPDQVLGLLGDHVETLHHLEELGPWHSHADGPRERHARFEWVGRVKG